MHTKANVPPLTEIETTQKNWMSALKRFIFFIFAFILHTTKAVDMSWTQYSDSASLPMSKIKREELREKLSKLDFEMLSERDRNTAERMMRALGQGDHSDESRSSTVPVGPIVGIVVITALGYMYYRRSTFVRYPDTLHLRQARAQKYD